MNGIPVTAFPAKDVNNVIYCGVEHKATGRVRWAADQGGDPLS